MVKTMGFHNAITMSTNYYWKKVPEYFLGRFSNIDTTSDESPYLHIGKRSNAGAFCPDCGTTLCKKGTSMAHNSLSDWYDKCPCCGKIVTTGITDFITNSRKTPSFSYGDIRE